MLRDGAHDGPDDTRNAVAFGGVAPSARRLKASAVLILGALVVTAVAGVALARLSVMTVIVAREPSSIELFMGLPADSLIGIFDMSPELLVEQNGTVDFERLRDGTWSIGDAILESVDVRLGAEAVPFEAMSMMVHPSDRRLPLNDPLDGLLAVSVCTVPSPDVPPRLSELYAYLSYIAFPDDAGRPLRLDFRQTGRFPMLVIVRDYWDGQLQDRSWSVVRDGGSLAIREATAPAFGRSSFDAPGNQQGPLASET